MPIWLERLIEVPFYILGTYLLGFVVILPGMVLGKMFENPRVPKWQPHVGVAVVGLFAAAIIFKGQILPS